MAAKKSPAPKTSGARAKTKRIGKGAGWGGPARGAHPNKPRYVFGKAGPGRGHFTLAGEGRMEREARHSEEMREILHGFATDNGREDSIRLQAATKLMDRIEGLPVQKLVQERTDPVSRMTDEQLDQHIEDQRALVKTYEGLEEPHAPGGR